MRIHYQRVAPFNPRLFIFELFPYYNRKTQYDPLTASAVYPGRRLNALHVRQTRLYQRLMHQRTRFSMGDPNLEIGGADIMYFAKWQTLLLPESDEKMGASGEV
jgi:hypothetical protein